MEGSVLLGPLLFLIFINDIVSDIGSNIRLFADDASMYLAVENSNIPAVTLQIVSQIGPINGKSTLIAPNLNVFSYHEQPA